MPGVRAKINLRPSGAETAIGRPNSQPGLQPISSFLLTADQMFTPNLNDKIAQFNLVTRHLATVSRHLRAGARLPVMLYCRHACV